MGRDNDAELVRRAGDGDLDAFDRLVARHRSRLFGIALQIAGDREAAQDLVQEALVQAFRALGALRQRERFGAWVNTIVRRQGQQWLRDGRRRPEPLDAAALRGAPTAMWEADPQPSRELVGRIRSALAALSQRDRRVMILHYLEGRSSEEIAARLRISAGGVRRRLHHSRLKVREECQAMAEASEAREGPRQLTVWIDGSPGEGRGRVFDHLAPRLAQAICLAVNKRAKAVRQVADEVAAHPDYVEETVADLLEMEVLVSPRKGQYLANFIALEAEDWRRLMALVREPAAEAAKRLAAAQARLRGAFETTPLAASGWAWKDVIWPIYAVLVANMGASRNQPASYRLPRPQRPGGGRYYLGGREGLPDLPVVWTTGFNGFATSPALGIGYFWTWALEREHPMAFSAGRDATTAFAAFAESPLTEQAALARLGGDGEHWREILAHLVKDGFLRRTNGELRAAIPVFAQGDSDALTSEVDVAIGPIIREVVEPALTGVASALDEMGYGHRSDQFPQWQRWLAGNVMGEAVRFLMEQDVLPRPGAPAAANFACIAWKPGLALMDWGIQY